jgi:hypothetical protein
MPTLNIRIKQNNENIQLPKELKAQRLELVRVTYSKNATAGNPYYGALYFDLDIFNGFESITNQGNNYLITPLADTPALQTYQLSQTFTSEDVRQAFNVKTYYRNLTGDYTPVEFDDTGAANGRMIWIDLVFNVSELYDYN